VAGTKGRLVAPWPPAPGGGHLACAGPHGSAPHPAVPVCYVPHARPPVRAPSSR